MIDRPMYYNREGKPITQEEWVKSFENFKEKIVQQDNLPGGRRISTVWLGLDHDYAGLGPPLIFETMVFGEEGNETDCERCSTWEEAERQHEAMVEKVRSTQN